MLSRNADIHHHPLFGLCNVVLNIPHFPAFWPTYFSTYQLAYRETNWTTYIRAKRPAYRSSYWATHKPAQWAADFATYRYAYFSANWSAHR